MSICIAPLSPVRLGVRGDMEMDLRIPYDPDEDRFLLALSDGTLIVGKYDPEDDCFRYRSEATGAGLVRIEGEVITIEWQLEWVAISLYEADAAPTYDASPMSVFDRA